MGVDLLYNSPAGRLLMKCYMKTGGIKFAAWFLNTKASKALIPNFIKKNQIDMKPFGNREYGSFAEFFSRQKEVSIPVTDQEVLISPSDSSLSIYTISKDMILAMKGSHYRLSDIIPQKDVAEIFNDGLCLIFRLQATDYHRFHAVDDLTIRETHFIEGQLHSVQPIACEKFPVYRLNRRWWHVLDSEHFGTIAQIEIGAMMVGGVSLTREKGHLDKGEELGYFTLAGSTIILLLEKETAERLNLQPRFKDIIDTTEEVIVKLGEPLE